MNENHFTMRKEILFCSLEDVIISSRSQVLLNIVKHNAAEVFEDSIDLSKVEGLDSNNILRLAMLSPYENPVCEVVDDDVLSYEEGWGDEPYDPDEEPETDISDDTDIQDILITDAIDQFVRASDPDLYNNAPKGKLGSSMDRLLSQRNALSKIYIYSEEFDVRIEDVLNSIFMRHQDIYEYVYGDLEEVVLKKLDSQFPPTAFIMNDIYDIKKLIDIQHPKMEFIDISLAKMGFNYIVNSINGAPVFEFKLDIDEDALKRRNIKFGVFDAYDLTDEYFTGKDFANLVVDLVSSSEDTALTPEEREMAMKGIMEHYKEIEEAGGPVENYIEDDDGTKYNLNNKDNLI